MWHCLFDLSFRWRCSSSLLCWSSIFHWQVQRVWVRRKRRQLTENRWFSNCFHSFEGFFKESFCLDEISSNILPLTCPTNHLIKLDRIVYGYSWSNDCSYIDKDCTMNVPPDDILCSTTNQCTVKVVQDPLILQDCWNLPATYIQAEYECIRGRCLFLFPRSLLFIVVVHHLDFSLENLCQTQEKILPEGFLSTPNYPNGFPSNLNCPCLLIAPIGHSILFEFIDIHLPNCSDAALLLWIGDQFQSKCQKQNPMSFIGNPHQNITLRFYSLTNVSRGGVLMKYSILPSNDNATLRLQCFSSPMSSMRNRSTTNFVTLKDLSRKFSTISSMTTEMTTTNKSKTNVEMVYSIGIVTGCVVLCLISINVSLCCLFLFRWVGF